MMVVDEGDVVACRTLGWVELAVGVVGEVAVESDRTFRLVVQLGEP